MTAENSGISKKLKENIPSSPEIIFISCIKWSLEEGYEINEGFASVFNDTLFISNTRTEFYIYCKDLRSVITRDSCNVNIEFPVKDSLLINGHGGGIKVSSVSEI